MKTEKITKMLQELKPGKDLAIFSTNMDEMKLLADENGCKIIASEYFGDGDGLIKVKKAGNGKKSRYQAIVEILQRYKTGYSNIPDEDVAYCRTVVSQFNTRSGKKFKVTSIHNEDTGEDHPQIYMEIEDRDHLTEQEYRMLQTRYHSQMDEFKLKIKPAEFFGENTYIEPGNEDTNDEEEDLI